MTSKNLLIILGATAVGKTKLAVHLAKELNGEVISADSRQIFRGMDVGTGKDLSEYQFGDQKIPYHLINIRAAGEKYHVNAFKDDFYNAFEKIHQHKRIPILCGGTGMYIHSLLQQQDYTAVPVNEKLRSALLELEKNELQNILKKYPKHLTEKVDLNSHKRIIRAIEIADFLSKNDFYPVQRVEINPFVIGLFDDVNIRREKILNRLKSRLQHGLIEEVEGLIADGLSEDILEFYGLEYKFVVSYLKGELSKSLLEERLGIAICQYAKRQMTFFRKMEKDGVDVNWIKAQNFEETHKIASTLIRSFFM